MPLNVPPKSQLGDPAWEIATLFPLQGEWSEEEYLTLDTNRLVEFSQGALEVLPMPTEYHQLIVQFVYRAMFGLEGGDSLGVALIAPFRVRLKSGKFRQPDVMFMLNKNRDRRHNQFWDGADLVVEVVSDDDSNRDLVTKRAEYARSEIGEYWIVDPRDRTIRVLSLMPGADEYREAGYFAAGQIAHSILLKEFHVSIDDVFEQS